MKRKKSAKQERRYYIYAFCGKRCVLQSGPWTKDQADALAVNPYWMRNTQGMKIKISTNELAD